MACVYIRIRISLHLEKHSGYMEQFLPAKRAAGISRTHPFQHKPADRQGKFLQFLFFQPLVMKQERQKSHLVA